MTDYDAVSVRADTVMQPNPVSAAAVEAVARAFCKRMGLDPDEEGMWSTFWSGPRARWQCYFPQAREAIAMHLAIKEVLP